MPRLITEWSTDDPELAKTLALISKEQDPILRLELEAGLHAWQAQHCIRQAERMRLFGEGYIRRRRTQG